MAKVVLYIATSLDGYIARTDGSLDWLYAIPNPEQIDHGYNDFFSKIGTTIMGGNTYREIIGFGVDWPYTEIDSYVVSNNRNTLIKSPKTHLISENLKAFVNKMRETEIQDIWLIGGGKLITHFLNNDLIDKMILTIVPTIIGNGIRLFPDNPKESTWNLTDVVKFSTGVINLTYEK